MNLISLILDPKSPNEDGQDSYYIAQVWWHGLDPYAEYKFPDNWRIKAISPGNDSLPRLDGKTLYIAGYDVPAVKYNPFYLGDDQAQKLKAFVARVNDYIKSIPEE